MQVFAFATIAGTLSAPLCHGALLALEKRSQSVARCLSNYTWADNSVGDSSCTLAAVVVGSCEGNSESGSTSPSLNSPSGTLDYTLDALQAGLYYQEPNTTNANPCRW